MMFSSPIPRAVQPRFNEGANVRDVSVRDDRNNSKQWQKNQIVGKQMRQDGSVLALLQRQISQLRKRQVGYLDNPASLQPFSIYQINNITDPTLSARTFQVRSAEIGFRSAYWVNVNPDGSNDFDSGVAGNFEQQLSTTTDVIYTSFFASDNAPPVANTGGNTTLSEVVDTQITDNTQIVIPNLFTGGGTPGLCPVAVWIKIIDDPTDGSYCQLWGRVWTFDGTIGWTFSSPFPSPDPSIIPIGIYCNQTLDRTDFEPFQYQSGNLLNRYAPNVLSAKITSPQMFRGYWTASSLSGQVFWNGDQVIDDTVFIGYVSNTSGGSPTSGFRGVYTYFGGSNIETTHPQSNGNFVITGFA